MRVCLDTSAYSQFKRGSASAKAAITFASWVGVPSIVLGELRAGFRIGKRMVENERELSAFLASPVVETLDVDDEAAGIYAEIVAHLRAAGTPVPTNDMWIAAVAAREGAPVVTFDAHFAKIVLARSLVLSD